MVTRNLVKEVEQLSAFEARGDRTVDNNRP
jgi:hypothetical protein